MKKYTKIFIIFSMLTCTLILTKFYLDLKDMQKLQNIVVEDEAKALSSLFIAFRKTYQDIFIHHNIDIDDKTIHLLPVRTNEEISKRFSDAINDKAIIRTVSDRPRNIKNKANNYEMNIISYFNEHPTKDVFFEKLDDTSFYFAKPLYITKSCLSCHGEKEETLPTIQKRYDLAYGYKEGELRGILGIKISKTEMINNLYNGFYRDVLTAIVVFALFLIAMYLTIKIIIRNENEYAQSLEQKVQQQINEIRNKDNILIQQSKMADMGEMIGNIAHQWRQPLSAISTCASSVIIQNELNILNQKNINESMESIVKNTRYLSQTIDDFRNFIKGDKKLDEFTVEHLLITSLEILHGSLTNASIEVITHIDTTLKIKSYENELIQILINIINNAKDALKENQKENRYLFIDAFEEHAKIIITIKDNAKGIPSSIIDKIFNPYFTTKETTKGTGLGLFMSQKLLHESLQGEIRATNTTFKYDKNEYSGALFSIKLPKAVIIA